MPTEVRLYCNECDIEPPCPFSSGYASIESKEGCLRELDDDLYIHYYHLSEEQLSLSSLKPTHTFMDQQAIAFIELMNSEVKYCPLVHKFNEYGKMEIAKRD